MEPGQSSHSALDEYKHKGGIKGWNIDIFKNEVIASNYNCNICNNICRRAVELSCDDDTGNHDVLYCESCLCDYLSSNNNQCPINPNHLNTNYNVARIIRKQINNLSVYCYNKTECEWNGKLNELSEHWKQCKHRIIDDDDSKCYAEITEQSIQKLSETVKSLKNELNQMKILYNLEASKKEIQYKSDYDLMQKQIKNQDLCIQSLSKQYEEISIKYECQNELIMNLTQKLDELTLGIGKNEKMKSVKSTKTKDEQKKEGKLGKIGSLRRSSSTRYFHPKGIELYHPKSIKYEMYHPKKATEVWVSKTMGSMCKLMRFPCCGSAKEGSIYLMEATSDKKWEEPLFIVQKENYPKYWHSDIHLGCKQNKKKNSKNTSYWECCKGDIDAPGCKKRYKCCKQEMKKGKGNGCKIGWGC